MLKTNSNNVGQIPVSPSVIDALDADSIAVITVTNADFAELRNRLETLDEEDGNAENLLNNLMVVYQYDHHEGDFQIIRYFNDESDALSYTAGLIAGNYSEEEYDTMLKVADLKLGLANGHITADEYEEMVTLLLGISNDTEWDSSLREWADPRRGFSIGITDVDSFLEHMPAVHLRQYAKALSEAVLTSNDFVLGRFGNDL